MSAVITPFEGTELFNTASFNNRISQINTGFSYISNPNLLDNWYFGNPVNQRGISSGTEWGGNKYGLDRWVAFSVGIYWDSNGYIVFPPRLGNNLIYQRLKKSKFIVGSKITLSLLTDDGNLFFKTVTYTGNTIYGVFYGTIFGNSEIAVTDDYVEIRIWYTENNASEGHLAAAKLELGSTQTLAHQEGDKWVLNEIPDYGEQLRRCQRYYRRWTGADNKPLGVAVRRESKVLELVFSLDTAMRVAPSLTFNGSFVCVPTFTWCSVTSIDIATPDTVSIFLKPNDDVTFGLDAYQINIANANEYIALSADL